MASVRELTAIAKKQLALRDQLWPGAEKLIWDRRIERGFTTIPKTMPLILKIMDEMTKGAPVSSTYLALWCSTWDNSFATLSKSEVLANASGFGGQRGEHTWMSRMRRLQELGFIDIKAGRSGPMSFALIYNPHRVIRWHKEQGTPGLTEGSYNALLEWALDIGAKDMSEPVESHTVPAGTAQPAPPTSPASPTIPTSPGLLKARRGSKTLGGPTRA